MGKSSRSRRRTGHPGRTQAPRRALAAPAADQASAGPRVPAPEVRRPAGAGPWAPAEDEINLQDGYTPSGAEDDEAELALEDDEVELALEDDEVGLALEYDEGELALEYEEREPELALEEPAPATGRARARRLGHSAGRQAGSCPPGRRPKRQKVKKGKETREKKTTQVVRRNRTLGVGLAVVILSSAVSWLAGSRIRSPAEIAARTAPPIPSLISVPAERRVLSSDVVVRGTVRYGAPQEVRLPVSSLKRQSGIVTTAAIKGKGLSEGGTALVVSGRPVFVLQGAEPAYRDMGPGAVGEDVRQLEAALSRLGFAPGSIDGVYDGRTASAVAAWYRRSGSTPLAPTEEQLALLRTEQSEAITAQSETLAAQEALSLARRDLALAEQRAGVLRGTSFGAVPGTPAPGLTPEEAAARARAEQQRVAAAVRLSSAQRALQKAEDAERAAQARLEEARRRNPPPSDDEYAALSRDARLASDQVALAKEEVVAAQEAVAAAGTAGELPPSSAAAAPDPILLRDSRLDAVVAQAEIDKAENAVAFAQRRVALLTSRSRYSPMSHAGISVPADEVLFFPNLPLRIDDVKHVAGADATGPLMTVSNSRLVVESAITANDAKLVREGAPVAIRSPDLNIDVPGVVSAVATTSGTHGVDPQRFYLEITPTELAVSLLGASVVQTISVQSTQGEVLAVPIAALSMGADGSSRVQVQNPEGQTRFVTVTPGLASKGMVEVTPSAGGLAPGDLVVVGGGPTGPDGGGRGTGR